MDHQTHEAVDEIFPSPGLLPEAAVEQIAVDFGQCHGNGAFRAYVTRTRFAHPRCGSLPTA
jgi:hypothetical protein